MRALTDEELDQVAGGRGYSKGFLATVGSLLPEFDSSAPGSPQRYADNLEDRLEGAARYHPGAVGDVWLGNASPTFGVPGGPR